MFNIRIKCVYMIITMLFYIISHSLSFYTLVTDKGEVKMIHK